MGKRANKRKKKNTSSGSDTEIEKSKGESTGENRGPSGEQTVSELLEQVNSVLFDTCDNNDSVFIPASPSSSSSSSAQTNQADMATKDTAQPSISDIFTYLKQMDKRLENMDQKLQTLDLLKTKVEDFDKDLKKLWVVVDDQNKEYRERLRIAEEKIESVEFSQDKLFEKVSEYEASNKALKEEVVYLQSQSMRNNLIFANIQEEEGEDAEKKLKEFFVQKMSIAQDCADKMVLERVHRMGPHRQGYVRSLVAKFHEFKDREFVRRQSKTLKGTNYFVNEQFPKEISDRRRSLIPKMKEARQQGKRSWISYDTLYVDGRPVRA